MKKLLLLGAAFVALGMTPTNASANDTYATVYIGATSLNDADNTGEIVALESAYDKGVAVGARIGRQLTPAFAVEGELAYRRNGADSLGITNFPLNPVWNGTTAEADGHVSSFSAMINGRVNVNGLRGQGDANSGLYLLGGVGVTRVNADISVGNVDMVDDSDVAFGYQVGLGYAFPVAEKTNIDIGYRYFGTSDISLTDAGGDGFDSEYNGHAIMVGLSKKF